MSSRLKADASSAFVSARLEWWGWMHVTYPILGKRGVCPVFIFVFDACRCIKWSLESWYERQQVGSCIWARICVVFDEYRGMQLIRLHTNGMFNVVPNVYWCTSERLRYCKMSIPNVVTNSLLPIAHMTHERIHSFVHLKLAWYVAFLTCNGCWCDVWPWCRNKDGSHVATSSQILGVVTDGHEG